MNEKIKNPESKPERKNLLTHKIKIYLLTALTMFTFGKTSGQELRRPISKHLTTENPALTIPRQLTEQGLIVKGKLFIPNSFPYSKSEINEQAKTQLDLIADQIMGFLKQSNKKIIIAIGVSSDQRDGPQWDSNNQELTEARFQEAKRILINFLRQKGITQASSTRIIFKKYQPSNGVTTEEDLKNNSQVFNYSSDPRENDPYDNERFLHIVVAEEENPITPQRERVLPPPNPEDFPQIDFKNAIIAVDVSGSMSQHLENIWHKINDQARERINNQDDFDITVRRFGADLDSEYHTNATDMTQLSEILKPSILSGPERQAVETSERVFNVTKTLIDQAERGKQIILITDEPLQDIRSLDQIKELAEKARQKGIAVYYIMINRDDFISPTLDDIVLLMENSPRIVEIGERARNYHIGILNQMRTDQNTINNSKNATIFKVFFENGILKLKIDIPNGWHRNNN